MRINYSESGRAAQAKAMLALCLLAASCATPAPEVMKGDENFATIYAVPVKCIARGACVSKVDVRAINGKTVSSAAAKYNYHVPPGELSVVVVPQTVLGDKMKYRQGVCELKWTAVAGKVYEIDRIIQSGGFFVTATTENGEKAASCFAPFG